MRRFQPSDWDLPDLTDWISALDGAIGAATSPPLLVAHSLACLLVAHWQRVSSRPVAGAFLVAVPDPESNAFPVAANSFANPPTQKLHFPSLIVASANDPYGTIDYSRRRADQWGGGVVEIGSFGHINGQSGLEDWPYGMSLLTSFMAGIGRPQKDNADFDVS
jgi:predicted alpha/beta hydrolase family esterase